MKTKVNIIEEKDITSLGASILNEVKEVLNKYNADLGILTCGQFVDCDFAVSYKENDEENIVIMDGLSINGTLNK